MKKEWVKRIVKYVAEKRFDTQLHYNEPLMELCFHCFFLSFSFLFCFFLLYIFCLFLFFFWVVVEAVESKAITLTWRIPTYLMLSDSTQCSSYGFWHQWKSTRNKDESNTGREAWPRIWSFASWLASILKAFTFSLG